MIGLRPSRVQGRSSRVRAEPSPSPYRASLPACRTTPPSPLDPAANRYKGESPPNAESDEPGGRPGGSLVVSKTHSRIESRRGREDRRPVQRAEPLLTPIDWFRLLQRVGEDGVVDRLVQLAVEEHQVEGGGLEPDAKPEDVIIQCWFHALCRAAASDFAGHGRRQEPRMRTGGHDGASSSRVRSLPTSPPALDVPGRPPYIRSGE